MTDVELYKILTEIKNDIDIDDTEKHTAMKTVMDDVKDRLCTINIGDEIRRTSTNELQVVTYIKDKSFLAIHSDGDTMPFYYERVDLIQGSVIRTGKNYPQIAEVLKALKGE